MLEAGAQLAAAPWWIAWVAVPVGLAITYYLIRKGNAIKEPPDHGPAGPKAMPRNDTPPLPPRFDSQKPVEGLVAAPAIESEEVFAKQMRHLLDPGDIFTSSEPGQND